MCEFDKQQGFHNKPYIGLEDIESNSGRFLGKIDNKKVKSSTFYFNNQHILFGRLRPYLNKVLVPDFEGHCSTEIFPIKVKINIDRRFLARWLMMESSISKINATCTGARMPRANMNVVLNFPIPLPPLAEQKRIVAILDKAFSAINKAKANAEKNLANAKELFESYLENLFSELFNSKDTIKISETAKVIGGYSFKSGDFKKEGKYQVIRMGNVRPGIIRESENPIFIDEMEEKALQKALLLPSDVIITQTGTKNKRDYGFTVIIEKENYLLNQRIAAIRFSKKILPKFFLYYSWCNIFKDQFFANETGTVGQGNVGIGAITNSVIPNVSKEAQQKIVRQLDALRVETNRLEEMYRRKIQSLDELKKSILKKAFRGELGKEKGEV